jgi:serine/threonine protein kinase
MNRIDLVINVLGKEGLSNIVISSTKDKGQKFYLHIQRFAPNRYEFDCCTDLIEFFRVMPIPGGIILKRPIPRPRWLLKRSAVNYKEKDKLGSGNFCDVFKGVVIDSTGKSTTAAIKVCHQEVTNEESLEAYEARRSMLREANLMSSYLHPNVIEFFGVSCDHFPVLVAMEFCPGGLLALLCLISTF